MRWVRRFLLPCKGEFELAKYCCQVVFYKFFVHCMAFYCAFAKCQICAINSLRYGQSGIFIIRIVNISFISLLLKKQSHEIVRLCFPLNIFPQSYYRSPLTIVCFDNFMTKSIRSSLNLCLLKHGFHAS